MKVGQWVGLVLLIVCLYVIWQIRQLLLLLFTAVVLATAIDQLVQRFQKRRIPRSQAVFLSVGILAATLFIILALIVPAFVDQFQQLINLLPEGLEQIESGFEWIEDRVLGRFELESPELIDHLIQQIQPLGTQLVDHSLAFFSTTLTAVLELIFVIAITLMLLINPLAYRQGFIRLFPAFYRQRVDDILSKCYASLGSWTIGALIEMGFIALLSGIGLWFLQVPLVLAHAVLAGILNLIPNIGPTLSVVLPMAIALLDAPWKSIAVLILYIVIQQIESYWLTPAIMAQQVALLPAITLMAQIFFATTFGALGLFMALPLTVVAKAWIEEVLLKDVMDQWHPPKATKP